MCAEGVLVADRDRTISASHCFYLFSKNNFLSIYVKMYVKDFATPCFSPVLAKNRLTGNPFFLGQIPNPGKIEKAALFRTF